MRIGNTQLEYFIDYLNKRVHLLDLDRSGMQTVTNAIDPKFQKRFIRQEHLLSDLLDFQWICYGTDGIVAEYKDYNFSFVPHGDQRTHQPYIEKMMLRRRGY